MFKLTVIGKSAFFSINFENQSTINYFISMLNDEKAKVQRFIRDITQLLDQVLLACLCLHHPVQCIINFKND